MGASLTCSIEPGFTEATQSEHPGAFPPWVALFGGSETCPDREVVLSSCTVPIWSYWCVGMLSSGIPGGLVAAFVCCSATETHTGNTAYCAVSPALTSKNDPEQRK